MTETRIRADYDQLAFVGCDQHTWVPSPQAGVERVMLDRVGDEVAVATSLVRYAPDSTFPEHDHAGGEEFIVLEGEFGDEHARYPAPCYVRNPPGTHHSPFSDPGCVIFVKLRQFDADDLEQFAKPFDLRTPEHGWQSETLHEYRGERVELIRAAAGVNVRIPASYYAREMLVVDGAITWQIDETHPLGSWSWLRVAPGHPLRVVATEPSVLFVKTRVHFDGRSVPDRH